MHVFSVFKTILMAALVAWTAHAQSTAGGQPSNGQLSTPAPAVKEPDTLVPAPAVTIKACTKPGVVALTFDDGPGPSTANLLDILAKEKIKATFFVLGENTSNPQFKGLVKRAFDEGHQIASHTFSHPHLPELSIDKVRDEMSRTETAIRNEIGYTPRYMRPPYGEINDGDMQLLRQMGYAVVIWDLDSNDWRYEAQASQHRQLFYDIQKSMEKATSQSNYLVLQHDIKSYSVDLVPEIISFIRNKGLGFATVGECTGYPVPLYRELMNSVAQDPSKEGSKDNEASSVVTKSADTKAQSVKSDATLLKPSIQLLLISIGILSYQL
ncbi:hypothetical protein BDF19DRAFT_397421 [Syncephalis fuscata]|nr:hypothetical protein BDF19DRAFT_397421 [Syncephalis fuscata]